METKVNSDLVIVQDALTADVDAVESKLSIAEQDIKKLEDAYVDVSKAVDDNIIKSIEKKAINPDGSFTYVQKLNSGAEIAFTIPQGEKGEKGDKGDPIRVTNIYKSVDDMNSDLAIVPVGDFVIAKTSENSSSLYLRAQEKFEFVTNFEDTLVPNMLTIEDGILNLTVDGDPIGEGVVLPTGVTGLGSE